MYQISESNRTTIQMEAPLSRMKVLQGYLAHKNPPPLDEHRRAPGVGLLWGPRNIYIYIYLIRYPSWVHDRYSKLQDKKEVFRIEFQDRAHLEMDHQKNGQHWSRLAKTANSSGYGGSMPHLNTQTAVQDEPCVVTSCASSCVR